MWPPCYSEIVRGSEQISPCCPLLGRQITSTKMVSLYRGMTRSHKKTENILRHSWAARPITLFQDHSDPSQCTFATSLTAQLRASYIPAQWEPLHSQVCKPQEIVALWHGTVGLSSIVSFTALQVHHSQDSPESSLSSSGILCFSPRRPIFKKRQAPFCQ